MHADGVACSARKYDRILLHCVARSQFVLFKTQQDMMDRDSKLATTYFNSKKGDMSWRFTLKITEESFDQPHLRSLLD